MSRRRNHKNRRTSATRNHLVSIVQAYRGKWSDSTTGDTFVCRVWASVWPVKSQESVINDSDTVVVTHRIRIDYRAGITGQMQVKLGARTFEIIGIYDLDEENRILEITAKELI